MRKWCGACRVHVPHHFLCLTPSPAESPPCKPEPDKPVILREAPHGALLYPGAWCRPKNLYPKRQDLSVTRCSRAMPGTGFRARGGRFFGRATGYAVFPRARGGRSLRMTGVFWDLFKSDLTKPVILREAPPSALRSHGSMAPTEESLSEAAGSFRHAMFPGVARKRVPREGREILRSRHWLRGFSAASGWALAQNDRCFPGLGIRPIPFQRLRSGQKRRTRKGHPPPRPLRLCVRRSCVTAWRRGRGRCARRGSPPPARPAPGTAPAPGRGG